MSDFSQSLSGQQSTPRTPLSPTSSTKSPSPSYTLNESMSASAPSTPLANSTATSSPFKPTLRKKTLKKTRKTRKTKKCIGKCTPTPASTKVGAEAYDQTVASILELSPADWVSVGQAAICKEQSSSRKGAIILQKKLVKAFKAASKAQLLLARLLRECHSLDPDTHAFRIFKTWKLANILSNKPGMAAQLKIEAANQDYNLGYTKVWEWIDFVAEDPKGMLEDIAILCDQVDKYGLGDGVDLRETLIAMEYYCENHYEALCRIHWEYRTVPRAVVVKEEVVSAHGRPVRARSSRQLG